MDPFCLRTTAATKRALDVQVARYLFATNTPFRAVENPEFIDMVSLL